MLGSNITYSEEWRQIAGAERVSTGRPIEAAAYFVSFIMLGTMIMLNLFTGVIINAMQEAQASHDENIVAQAKAVTEGPARRIEADVSNVNDKLKAIVNQLNEVSEDIAALKEQTYDAGSAPVDGQANRGSNLSTA
jgi:voltage-gated sodium channel